MSEKIEVSREQVLVRIEDGGYYWYHQIGYDNGRHGYQHVYRIWKVSSHKWVAQQSSWVNTFKERTLKALVAKLKEEHPL